MNWKIENDNTPPIITAEAHVRSAHGGKMQALPETAVIFFMSGWEECLVSERGAEVLMEKLPRFLTGKPVYRLTDGVCFTDGGRGAPHAVDTVETLHALGVKTIVSVGMFGAFGEGFEVGDIAVPSKVFIEEGTSHHYAVEPQYSEPDNALSTALAGMLDARQPQTVSTDAVYRQTFMKEALWREKGAVGVDMETSAVFTAARFLGMSAAAVLIVSDKHPMDEKQPKWSWRIDRAMRMSFIERVCTAVEELNN
ncbi:MAG: nucleoside phosphorylase [Clostridia bacterium]|nr:nucleoside phosphorylase [Clostridia bacterium]